MGYNQNEHAAKSEVMSKLFKQVDDFTVASQLAALSEEVRQLREALMPPKSMIITGPEVERLMAALTTKDHP